MDSWEGEKRKKKKRKQTGSGGRRHAFGEANACLFAGRPAPWQQRKGTKKDPGGKCESSNERETLSTTEDCE